jgi:branched-chain amino acid aminotransferase
MSSNLSNQFDQAAGILYLDGRLYKASNPEAKVSPGSHTIQYANGVFEGETVVNGSIFRSREHSERLIRSADLVRLPHNLTVEIIEEAKRRVLHANQIDTGYVRPFLFRDPSVSVKPGGLETHFCVMAFAKDSYWPSHVYEQGLRLATAEKHRRVPPECWSQEAKSGANYQASILAQAEAADKDADDAVMLDLAGNVLEVSVANIFYFSGGKLHTPAADDRFLNGITRQTVIELARKQGIDVIEEQRVTTVDLHYADEIFTTGSATGITPVRQFDRMQYPLLPVPEGTPHAKFKVAGGQTLRLMTAYAELIRKPTLTSEQTPAAAREELHATPS